MIERIIDLIELQFAAGFFLIWWNLEAFWRKKTGSGTIISTKGLITAYQKNTGLSFAQK